MFKRYLLILIAVLLVAACDSTPASTAPQATPTPLSTNAQITADAQVALFGDNITSSYTPGTKTAIVTETIKDQFDNHGFRVEIESDCFDIQNKLWHDSSLHLSTVEIHMLQNLIDTSNGHAFTKVVAICTLKAATEAGFTWGNMNGESAWTAPAYDLVYLDPRLSQ